MTWRKTTDRNDCAECSGVSDQIGLATASALDEIDMQQIKRINCNSCEVDFAELVQQGRPVVLQSWIEQWPALAAVRSSEQALIRYLRQFDQGYEVDTLLMAADTAGKVGYQADDLAHFNYERRQYPVWAVLQQLDQHRQQPSAVRIALQSARLDLCLPGFSDENPMPAIAKTVVGRIWAGNQTVVPAHFDHAQNLACVLAGRRIFTLFPPEQISNLYLGPLQHAPTGTPISLVDITAPDYQRFPRYRIAEAAGFRAELGPGDVLFLPALWWHHVQATSDFNILLNYWWGGSVGTDRQQPSPYAALLHTLLALDESSATEREHWKKMFDYLVFRQDAEQFSHIPTTTSAIQREFSEQNRQSLLDWLQKEFSLQCQQSVKNHKKV